MRYYDNTRLDDARTCERYYYFRHIRNWRKEGISVDLVFGLAWHDAMDIVWGLAQSSKSDKEITEIAFNKFISTWKSEGLQFPIPPEVEQEGKYKAKTPGIALEMIFNYIIQRRGRLNKMRLLSIERPFAVFIDPDNKSIMYIGRIDKEFELEDGVYAGEHKTTGLYRKEGNFSQDWIDLFSISPQVGGYNHKLHMDYGDRGKATWIDAALVHKDIHDAFKFIPVERRLQDMDSWQFDVLTLIKRIEEQTRVLNNLRASQPGASMRAFPKNTKGCFQYMKLCPYFDICRFWGNPEKIEKVPDGFIEEKWEPFNILNINQLGLEDENNDR